MEMNVRVKSYVNGGDFWFVISVKMLWIMVFKVLIEVSDIY